MEPLLIVLVAGLVGGLLLALLIAVKPHRPSSTFVPRRLDNPSPALINMAHIRVEGLGGLGLVAAVVAVAIADSRIRVATIAAALLGTALALTLIAIRRRTGAMPSGGDGPDARSILHLEPERRPRSRAGGAATDAGAHDEEIFMHPAVASSKLLCS
jgi:hypothetical protein